MEKQIIYPGIVTRVFATTVDMFLLSVVISPIVNFISPRIFVIVFKDLIVEQGINMSDGMIASRALQSEQFVQHITFSALACYSLPIILVQLSLISTYFIWFWHNKSWTPGKYVLGIRIFDEQTMKKPSISQCIKRFLSLSFSLFGVWFIVFTNKKQALHDKIAGTIIVKS